jgi:hypothetical protein
VKPLLFAEARVRSAARRLTPSGVYYLPFGQPHRPAGAGSVALHVADGSEIVSERADGPALTVGVGRFGGERYGSCLARLGTPALAVGWLPILATRYVDSSGARYRQESFGVRIPQTRSLVSFVRLTVVGGPAATTLRLRLRPSVSGISASGDRLMRAGLTYLFFTPGARVGRSSLAYSVPAHAERTIYLARLVRPARSEPLALDETAYERARSALLTYWSARLAQGTTFVVPERRVLDAERNLLIQNLVLAWRYSVGNAYQEFSFPESIDAAEVMGEYGFQAVDRSILRAALGKRLALYPDLEIGEKLLGSALYSDLYADPGFVGAATTVLRRYVRSLERQLHRSRVGLLPRERYSSDLPDSVYGLNSQAVIWQGLRLMASVWARTGHPNLARTARTLAARLGLGLRRAVRESERWLPDGSLFVPVKLLDGEQPYGAVTESKAGSYWNLTMPYALASRLFPADGRQARGVLRYLLNHGSRLLGLVRAGAYTLYGDAPTPTGGTDQVYGVNVSRFLADNHQPGQLALSLYGQLAGAMTPQTFVAGEAASVAPIRGEYFRRMYLPPNSVANASFLETLRLMLIHETSRGLELGYATPRAWLQPGRRIVVRGAPTRFGRVSLSVESLADSVRVQLDAPRQARLLSLRLRLPGATGIAGVTLNGRPFRRFGSESVDLSGRAGMLSLLVRTRRRP